MAEYFPFDVNFKSYSGSFSGSFFGDGSNLTNVKSSNISGSVTSASYALSASYAANGGVTQLLAGPNVTLSPTNGYGQVTVSATLSGSTIFNTATGSYGSFYDTTTQTNPVGNVPRSMSFDSTDITNGVSISGSTSPFNTYIKTTNAGVYNIQFSAQVDKTDSGNDEIVIWLRKNGIDLTDTATTLTLSGNNDKKVAAWNWFVTSAANDYYQIIWISADTNLRLLAEPISGTHPGIPSVILTANRVDQFLSNTGSFSGSFNGSFTGSLFGTASWATNALTASFINTASTNAFVQNGNSFGATALLGTNDNQSLAFETSGSTRMFISSSGNVGVGTTTPPYKLTVQGTTLTDSSVSVQGAFNLNPLTAPTAIGGYTLSAGSSLGVGTYYYFAVYVTALGETSAGSTLTVITTAGNTTVNLTGIPVSSDPRVTARKIYRTKLNGTSDNEWFLTTISNNVTTTLTDNIADASLTGVGLQAYKVNTTSRYITTNGTQGMILDANLTALGLSAGATIISTNAAAVRSVFIGALAGENVTTGTANVLVGGAAGRNLTTGGSNTLIGDLAGYVISNASNNTAIGSQTARYLTTGGNNIIIGVSSANVLTDGSTQFTQGTNNTILGNSIRMSTITDTNSIVIGNTAWSLGSNTTVLGNDSTTRTALRGNVSMGTTGSISSTLHIKGSGATSATTALRVENTNASASFVVRDNGSVGIGTATPSVPLEVVGNTIISGSITQRGSVGILFYDSSGNGGGRIHGSYNYLNGEVYITPSGSLFQNFVFSPNNGMSIGGFSIGGTTGSPPAYGLTVSGSIGIGTRTPITQLDVSGSG